MCSSILPINMLPSFLTLVIDIAQSVGAVEYTDGFSAGYDTKKSDGEVAVILQLWGMWSTLLSYHIYQPLRSGRI